MKPQKGAALIIALWAMAFLSVLMGGVVAAVRLENRQSVNELNNSHALISAEAGIALAVERLLVPNGDSMVADGRDYPMTFNGVRLNVSVHSERGKLDLNSVDIKGFERLLRYLGAGPAQTLRLAEQLQQLRSAGQSIKGLEQLQAFEGMEPSLYARLEPNITLWTALAVPDPAFATPDVRAALGITSMGIASAPGAVVTIRSQAQLPDGFSGSVQATLYLTADGGSTQLYRVLRWQE